MYASPLFDPCPALPRVRVCHAAFGFDAWVQTAVVFTNPKTVLQTCVVSTGSAKVEVFKVVLDTLFATLFNFNGGLNLTYIVSHVGKQKLSQWWPFCFKRGWVGPSFPTRDGFTPPSHPHRHGARPMRIESDNYPRLEKGF